MHFFPRQGYLQSCWPYMYITTICATIFTKYAEITICRQKIVAILFYFFYNRSIRNIKRLNHKNSLYEFYILAFFLPESFCAYLALFFPCCQMQQGRHFHYLIIYFIFMKGPRSNTGYCALLLQKKRDSSVEISFHSPLAAVPLNVAITIKSLLNL